MFSLAIHSITSIRQQIEEYIHSSDFRRIHLELKGQLEIEDMTYEISIEDIKRTEDGYPDRGSKGTLRFNDDSSFNVILFIESIADFINNMFYRVNSQEIFYKIMVISVNYFLVHELIHVRQVKQGKVSPEIMEELKGTPYNERPIEIEAFRESIRIMKAYGPFVAKIIDIIESKQYDNEIDDEVSKLYQECRNQVDNSL